MLSYRFGTAKTVIVDLNQIKAIANITARFHCELRKPIDLY